MPIPEVWAKINLECRRQADRRRFTREADTSPSQIDGSGQAFSDHPLLQRRGRSRTHVFGVPAHDVCAHEKVFDNS